MHTKGLSCTLPTLLLVLVLPISAWSQRQGPVHFSGIINDFTAAHNAAGRPVGPWEMRGEWRLDLMGDSGTANFSAVLTMEDSDYWLVISPNPPANPDSPASRSPHTHHIMMEHAQVIWDASACPTASYSPPTTTGFMVRGMASVTGNGGPAPFAPNGELSPLDVCITGGSEVQDSNITLVLGAPASAHFGSQPINGAVRTRK